MAKRKPKCKVCKAPYEPRTTLQQLCGKPDCAIEWAKRQREKRWKDEAKRRWRDNRDARERLKTYPQLIKEAQAAFNAFIRSRDEGKPCICCGRQATDADVVTGSRWDAGHYRSTGAAPHLRFHEDNCHRQLVYCNQYRSGNAVDYRLGLISRIGLERVEILETDQGPVNWTKDDIREIRDTYRRKLRDLKKAKEESPGPGRRART